MEEEPVTREELAGETERARPTIEAVGKCSSAIDKLKALLVAEVLDPGTAILSMVDCIDLATRLQANDPRVHPEGKPIGMDDLTVQRGRAFGELLVELHEGILPLLGVDLILWRGNAHEVLSRCREAMRLNRSSQSRERFLRFQAVLRGYIQSTGSDEDHERDIAAALDGTEREDQDTRAMLHVLGTLLDSRGADGLLMIKDGRWCIAPRQTRMHAGVTRFARTTAERAKRGQALVPLPRGCAAGAMDPADALDAIRAMKELQRMRDERGRCRGELAGIDNLVDDVPLTEAAKARGCSRQQARDGRARVIEEVRRRA